MGRFRATQSLARAVEGTIVGWMLAIPLRLHRRRCVGALCYVTVMATGVSARA